MRVNGKVKSMQTAALWDWVYDRDLKSYAQSRPYIGDFYEEATRALMGGVRLRTDAQSEICPDIVLPSLDAYVEVKSVGRGNSRTIYEHRIEKYKWLASRHPVYFAFWFHSMDCTELTTLFKLQADLAASTQCVCVIRADDVFAAYYQGKLRATSYSGERRGGHFSKMPARTLPASFFRRVKLMAMPLGSPFKVYGQTIQGVQIGGNFPWEKVLDYGYVRRETDG